MKIFLIGLIYLAQIKTVYIQPLGNVDAKYINTVKKSIESFYGFPCKVRPAVEHNTSLYGRSKTRYSADKILEHFKSEDLVIVVTERDIAIALNRSHPEYGIFGLSSMYQNDCVVSTFRLNRKSTNSEQIFERLSKITIHEIGHNLGLKHCYKDKSCLMSAANGTIAQIDFEKIHFCKTCINKLNQVK